MLSFFLSLPLYNFPSTSIPFIRLAITSPFNIFSCNFDSSYGLGVPFMVSIFVLAVRPGKEQQIGMNSEAKNNTITLQASRDGKVM